MKLYYHYYFYYSCVFINVRLLVFGLTRLISINDVEAWQHKNYLSLRICSKTSCGFRDFLGLIPVVSKQEQQMLPKVCMLWNSTTLNSVVSLHKVSPLAKNIRLWIFISVELFKERIHAKRMVVVLEKKTFPQRSSFAGNV